jgi:hypothetical protein
LHNEFLTQPIIEKLAIDKKQLQLGVRNGRVVYTAEEPDMPQFKGIA